MLVAGIQGKSGEQEAARRALLSHGSGRHVKQTVSAQQAGVFVRVALWMRLDPP